MEEKRPPTAYFAFASEMRKTQKITGSIPQQAKLIGQLWSQLSDEEKQDRQKTQNQLILNWKETHVKKVEIVQKPLENEKLAFQIFCNTARKRYFKEKNLHLKYSVEISRELKRQFEPLKDNFIQASFKIAEIAELKSNQIKDYNCWVQ
ncbi:HMG (High mobility group) box domain-containing protein [Spironucleus salmonicida]|uniref:HMG (High mobility group) box domain-containing protein n=1 Tax=Spironucleus salmonicida TaxID=348837 RepID=V6LS06_9EUKA|nr:HMG (High mobility group) box domain-containing protein [Spironucleus salmonicida]|eukprot:EST43564.1 HMG (high mobility group) box domain-containing protein [Spironucleus salmonicida]